jgi:hypothetical protein
MLLNRYGEEIISEQGAGDKGEEQGREESF